MLITKSLLRRIQPSLDDSHNHKMLRRYAIFSRRVVETKIWSLNYQHLAQANSRWWPPMSTQRLFPSSVVGCTPTTGLHSMKIKLRTSFLLRYGLGQSRVLLAERAEVLGQHMQPAVAQIGRIEATKKIQKVLSKQHEFRRSAG